MGVVLGYQKLGRQMGLRREIAEIVCKSAGHKPGIIEPVDNAINPVICLRCLEILDSILIEIVNGK